MPPFFCASAMTCRASVVLPEDRPVDLDDAPARQAADAERDVEPEGARRDRLHVDRAVVGPQPHDRALAEVLLDVLERLVERLVLVHLPCDDAELRSVHVRSHLIYGL